MWTVRLRYGSKYTFHIIVKLAQGSYCSAIGIELEGRILQTSCNECFYCSGQSVGCLGTSSIFFSSFRLLLCKPLYTVTHLIFLFINNNAVEPQNRGFLKRNAVLYLEMCFLEMLPLIPRKIRDTVKPFHYGHCISRPHPYNSSQWPASKNYSVIRSPSL